MARHENGPFGPMRIPGDQASMRSSPCLRSDTHGGRLGAIHRPPRRILAVRRRKMLCPPVAAELAGLHRLAAGVGSRRRRRALTEKPLSHRPPLRLFKLLIWLHRAPCQSFVQNRRIPGRPGPASRAARSVTAPLSPPVLPDSRARAGEHRTPPRLRHHDAGGDPAAQAAVDATSSGHR